MDKILLTAFLSALAGFITATISIVKLVNEKESKTTDYRQAWTDSVRKSIGDLVGLINAQAHQLHIQRKNAINATKLEDVDSKMDESLKNRLASHADDSLKQGRIAIRETRKSMHEVYAFTRLHFKPNDLSFNRIEQKFDIVLSLLEDMGSSENDEATMAALKERVQAAASEITYYARDILKIEWETVKKGEPAYSATKRWSIICSIVMFFVLMMIGVHAVISFWKQGVELDAGHKPSRIENMGN